MSSKTNKGLLQTWKLLVSCVHPDSAKGLFGIESLFQIPSGSNLTGGKKASLFPLSIIFSSNREMDYNTCNIEHYLDLGLYSLLK